MRFRLTARAGSLLVLGVLLPSILALSPTSASAAYHTHKIVVSIRQQHLWAYDNGQLIISAPVATGRPALPTPPGVYHILYKRSPFQFISPWPWWSPYYYNPAWVHYAMLFRWDGYFLHDAPWRWDYGPGSNYRDGTHGCVNIPLRPMRQLYYWARIGDEVVVTRN